MLRLILEVDDQRHVTDWVAHVSNLGLATQSRGAFVDKGKPAQ
jgi:hypothetical protein